ncbi:hypothetical protein Tco_1109682 [Tanacetum coccineum]
MKRTKGGANLRFSATTFTTLRVFALSTRTRLRVLTFWRTTSELSTKEKNTVSKSRSACSQTTCPSASRYAISCEVIDQIAIIKISGVLEDTEEHVSIALRSKLLLGVNWGPARLTIKHMCLLKNLGSIFCLRQEYAKERAMLTFGGRGTSTHVLLSIRALYSSHIACFQLGSRRAWKGDLGIGEEVEQSLEVLIVELFVELFVDLFVGLFVVVFVEEK